MKISYALVSYNSNSKDYSNGEYVRKDSELEIEVWLHKASVAAKAIEDIENGIYNWHEQWRKQNKRSSKISKEVSEVVSFEQLTALELMKKNAVSDYHSNFGYNILGLNKEYRVLKIYSV